MIIMMILLPLLLQVVFFFFFGTKSVNLVFNKSKLTIGSGVTLNITPRKEFFTSYTYGDFRMLKMDNDMFQRLLVLAMFAYKQT